MIRLIIATLLMATATMARAGDCYYYWTHQCVEVIDASQRQLQQNILISPSINYLQSDGQSCEAAAEARQQPLMERVLSAFNERAQKIRACDAPLASVTLRVFDSPRKATWYFDRTIRPSENKNVVTVDNLPPL